MAVSSECDGAGKFVEDQDEAEFGPAPALTEGQKAKMKKVVKEGGKRGVEIEGAADMGGLQFFCTSVEEPDGDLVLLKESLRAMNAKPDEAAEERKGGSGHVGKMIFSAGTEQLAVVAYVPKAKRAELDCVEWLKAVLATQSGEVVGESAAVSTGCVKANPDKGIFPLKIREAMIVEANNFLRKRGLFPDDDDDDDEMVFGDDDFPSAEQAAAEEAPEAEEAEAEDAEEEEDAVGEAPQFTEAQKGKMKKVVKEGGKRGVEIEGAADMGGLQFFCTSVDEPEGDLVLLKECLRAMNAKADDGAEERKGGSGHIGKMLFSAGTEQLAVVAYVPKAKRKELDCAEWLKAVLDTQSGEVVGGSAAVSTGCVKANADKGIFPLKIRESMIVEANNFLRKRGLFPEDDDDDDEMVFGDDDFPSA